MKKITALLLLMLMLLCLCSCGGSKTVIGFISDMPPFYYQTKDGNYDGIDVSLMNAIGEDCGLNYDTRHFSSVYDVENELSDEKIDCFLGTYPIADYRKEKFDFSEVYFEDGVELCVSLDNDSIKSLEDLKDKSVGVLKDTEMYAYSMQKGSEYGFNTVEYSIPGEMYVGVVANNIDACFIPSSYFKCAENDGIEIKSVFSEDNIFQYAFVFNKGKNEELKEKINQSIKNIKSNGKYDEILKNYEKIIY